MHLVGLHFAFFLVWHLLLQMFVPFVISLLASMALFIVSIRWVVFWFGGLFSVGLAHFNEVIFFESRSLASQISSQCTSWSGSMVRRALNAMIVKVLGWNQMFVSIDCPGLTAKRWLHLSLILLWFLCFLYWLLIGFYLRVVLCQ